MLELLVNTKRLFSILTVNSKHENYGTHLPLPRAVLCTPASRINQDVKTCSCGNARLLFSRHEDGEFDLGLEME